MAFDPSSSWDLSHYHDVNGADSFPSALLDQIAFRDPNEFKAIGYMSLLAVLIFDPSLPTVDANYWSVNIKHERDISLFFSINSYTFIGI